MIKFNTKRIEDLEEKYDKLEYRIQKLEMNLEGVAGKQDLFVKRIDEMSVTLDRMFNILLERSNGKE